MDDEKILSKKKNNINTFKPYIAADRTMTEFSFVSIVLGALIAVVFGAANAYLGLKVGLTISASIPAAVISMGIIRGIMRRKSILENNMVQTIGSAGESLAAGVIFTIPVLFLWASQYDSVSTPGVFKIFLISLFGGFVGVVMMIPLRKFLIVQEHNRLPYPEGTACGDILVAGEEGGSKATTVFAGLGIGALFKFLQKGIGLFSESVETVIPGIKNAAVGADIQPALLGVGFIIGPKISAYMLGGAVLGWLCFIPAISIFGAASSEIIPPALGLISDLDHWEIWNRYIRYIGAGAVAFAGIISLLKSLPVILKSFKSALGGFKIDRESQKRTERDIPMKIVVVIIAVIIVILAFLPQIPTGIIGALLVAVFGFFFVTVSSRIVGVVGSSSNPISGMTIATLLLTTLLLKAVGITGIEGMVTAITVGGLVCIAAAIAGDTSQDLKSGFIVGATPWKQQIGEFIGVFVSALVMGSVLYLLHNTYGFGSKELAAPQATLMKLVIEGVMQANLPWGLVFIGAASAAVIELLGVSALPFAVGLYLPLHLSTPVMIGGVVRGVLGIFNYDRKKRSEKSESGVLYSSGLIAGEGVMGIIIASFVFFGVKTEITGNILGDAGGIVFFLMLIASLVYFTFFRTDKKSSL